MIYEGALTDAFSEIILNELYDTGALYESLQIFSFESGTSIIFDVQCNDYIKYHIDRLDLLNRLADLPALNEAYNRYIMTKVEESIKIALESLDAPDPVMSTLLPSVRITVNGE